MLLGWHDLVEGLFEIRGKDRDATILLNLLDDLEYRTYWNIAEPLSAGCPRADSCMLGSSLSARSPERGWSPGVMTAYRKSDATRVAQAALELAVRQPELVFRNPEKVQLGWEQMRQDRAAFVEFFGADELVLPPAEVEEQINAFHRHQQEAAVARQPGRFGARTSLAWTYPCSAFRRK